MAVAVSVGVSVGCGGESVTLAVGVAVGWGGSAVIVTAAVGVDVGVGTAVSVDVDVGSGIAVSVGVGKGVTVGWAVAVASSVRGSGSFGGRVRDWILLFGAGDIGIRRQGVTVCGTAAGSNKQEQYCGGQERDSWHGS